MQTELTGAFSRRIAGAFGQAGQNWLQSLPSILDDLSSDWSITLKPVFQEMSYSYVAPVVRTDGSEAVLKVAVPNRELQAEIGALRMFNGQGAVRLIDSNPEMGALLLERAKPGRPLLELTDDELATTIAGQVMLQLWGSNVQEGIFPSVEDWSSGLHQLRGQFDGGTGPFPKHLVATAEAIFRDLIQSMDETTLLHGDLHHWNILSAGRESWLAIDPKGVIGEPAYEIGAWLRNPFPSIVKQPHPEKTIVRRIDQFAEELRLDRKRILGWALAQSVLAAWWSYEDGEEDLDLWLACAKVFAKLE